MKTANGWPLKPLSVGSLFLDPKNPRLIPTEKTRTERDLIEELAVHENVLELAKKIKVNGFFPSEPLIAVIEAGRKFVVEGNRRLAACKLLVNPSLAPKGLEKRVKALAGNFNAQTLGRVPVLLAPSREATFPLIIARHTDTQIEKWQTPMKAHFYSNLIESGLSVEDVAERFNVDAASVREGLHDHNLYRMACRLELPETEAQIVRDPRKFSLTTLRRVFETPAGRDFFGVQLSDDGKIRGHVAPEQFKRAFTKLVADVANGEQDSRSLNSPAEIKGYLEKYGAAKPDKKAKGNFDSDSFEFKSQKPSTHAPTPKPQKKSKNPGSSVGLIPSNFPCGASNSRVQALVAELKKLSPMKFPNASAFAFRSLIEIGAYCFLEGRNEISMLRAAYEADVKKKNANRAPERQIKIEHDWTPNLNAMMNHLGDATQNCFANKHTVKALNKVIKEEEELFGLNLSTHNTSYHPNEDRLRATWRNLEEFFREVLA